MSTVIAAARLENHCITRSRCQTPAELAAWMGVVQSQDYADGIWSMGLRLPATLTAGDVDAAADRGDILRTHLLNRAQHSTFPRETAPSRGASSETGTRPADK